LWSALVVPPIAVALASKGVKVPGVGDKSKSLAFPFPFTSTKIAAAVGSASGGADRNDVSKLDVSTSGNLAS